MRALTVVAMLVGAACAPNVPAPPAPAPITVTTTKTPGEIASAAVRALADAEFEITVTDGEAGVVSARRTALRTDNAAFIRCEREFGSANSEALGTRTMTSTVTVSVTAARGGATTTARISAIVRAEGTGGFAGIPIACVSSGEIERRVAEAIRGA